MVKPTRVTNDIRARRFAAGEMTQADLAQQVGLTRQTVIAIEQGRYSPSLEVAFKIARVLGASIEEVFHYPSEPGPRPTTAERAASAGGHEESIRPAGTVHYRRAAGSRPV